METPQQINASFKRGLDHRLRQSGPPRQAGVARTLKVFHLDTKAPGKSQNLPSWALGLKVASLSFEDLYIRRSLTLCPQTSECHKPLCATISISGA